MDLNRSRARQKDLQQRSARQPSGIGQIGDRDPLTGRYEVIYPDGGANPNGVKVTNAWLKPGDVVLLSPRTDGVIAIESDKATSPPSPPIFNAPIEGKKAKTWIFYADDNQLYVGGHQAEPVLLGPVVDVSLFPSWESNGEIYTSDPASDNFHVWAEGDEWIATWRTIETSFIHVSKPAFYSFEGSQERKTVAFIPYDLHRGAQYYGVYIYDRFLGRGMPLGGGFTSISQRYWDTSSWYWNVGSWLEPFYTRKGYLKNDTFNSTQSPKRSFFGLPSVMARISAADDSIVPHVNKTFGNTQNFLVAVNTINGVVQIDSLDVDLIYPILCDSSLTYWIRVVAQYSGGPMIRRFELYSSDSPNKPLAVNSEPVFFDTFWSMENREDLGGLAGLAGLNPGSPHYYVARDDFALKAGQLLRFGFYRSPTEFLIQPAVGGGYLVNSMVAYRAYRELFGTSTTVTLSSGIVTRIRRDEIMKAKEGSGYLRRFEVTIDNKEIELSPVFCHEIPKTAKILHWCTVPD